ncbi:hypothetical protein [Arthrobacter sp. Z1-15]
MSDEISPRPAPVLHGTGPLGRLARMVSVFYGDAERDRVTEPVRHLHDPVEDEIDRQLASISVETDTGGRHYAVRRLAPAAPDPAGPGVTYRYFANRPLLNAPEA